MKIEMEFQGLKELMKAFEDAASDEDIKEVNQKIVKQSEPVVKNIMSGKIPKSADIKLSGRGFGSKSSVTSHAADSIPLGAVKVKDTGASADVGWEKSDNSEHFYVKFINWGTIYRPPQEFIYATGREADAELQKIAEQEYQSYLRYGGNKDGKFRKRLKRICDFATGNAHTIVLIYAIVAVIVWVAVNLYFWKISFDLDREIREEMREYGDCYSDTDEAKFGKHITRLTGFIISIPAAVMWWCTPLIVAGLMIYDKIQEKNPELCGFKADDFDKEENK